jgi:uncharacterized protein
MTQNQPPAYPTAQPLSPGDERLWATLTHISGLLGFVLFGGFLGWVGPLIAYLVLRERSAFVAEHAKTALNFQITMAIAGVIAAFLWIVLVGFLLTIAIGVVVIVFSIIAAVAANRGQSYQYPLAIPFIK